MRLPDAAWAITIARDPLRSLHTFVIFLALMGLLLLAAFYSYRAVARKQASKPVAAGRAAPNAGLLCSVGCGKALGMIILIIPSFPGRGKGPEAAVQPGKFADFIACPEGNLTVCWVALPLA